MNVCIHARYRYGGGEIERVEKRYMCIYMFIGRGWGGDDRIAVQFPVCYFG